jgi:glycosyltransferase involved in cell wall biosynthesis
VIDRATVALVCSRDEAFGRVTVEAMKRGRPVVGAAAGGTGRLIEDGVTGRLYPPGDPAALAAVVGELLGDDATRARIARAGWAWAAETFTSERQADGFLAAADEVCAARQKPKPSRRPLGAAARAAAVRAATSSSAHRR